MYIKTISIVGVGGISNLDISFNSQMNFICGPNGIGKTTVLESIAHLFSLGDANIIKRNSRLLSAQIKGVIMDSGAEKQAVIDFDTFQPEKSFRYFNVFHELAAKIIVLKTNRTFEYRSLDSVGRDVLTDMHKSAQDAKNGIQITDVKNWFVNRYLYSAHGNSLSQEQMSNFQFAKNCFTLLNSSVVFSKVDAASNDIMVKTPSGEVY
jgi:predicted ATP-dependent endonuclease of OLD family